MRFTITNDAVREGECPVSGATVCGRYRDNGYPFGVKYFNLWAIEISSLEELLRLLPMKHNEITIGHIQSDDEYFEKIEYSVHIE